MAFFFSCVYLIVVLIRPQELIDSMQEQPFVMYTLLISLIPYFFSKKNSGSPQLLLLFLMILIIVISAILNGWSGGVIKLVPEFLASAVVPFILFSKLTTTAAKHKSLILISSLAALIMVHNGLSQTLSDVGIGWSGSKLSQGTRITYLGTLADPNDLGMFFVMMIPFPVYFIAKAKAMTKFFWILTVLALLYGVYLTNSRGAFLGVLSLFGLWALQRYGLKKVIPLALFVLPIVALIASKFRTIDAEEESAAGRVEAWYTGFQMLIHNPFFGVGMNNFTNHHHLTAHNSYVLVFSELGIFGFITWLSFLVLTCWMLYKIAFYKSSFYEKETQLTIEAQMSGLTAQAQEEIQLAKVSLYSIIGYLVTAFFLSRSYCLVLYIYTGIGLSSYYRAQVILPELSPLEIRRSLFRISLIALFAIIFLYVVVRILL